MGDGEVGEEERRGREGEAEKGEFGVDPTKFGKKSTP